MRHKFARGQRRDLAGRRAGRYDKPRGATGVSGASDGSKPGGNTASGPHGRRANPGGNCGTGRDGRSPGSKSGHDGGCNASGSAGDSGRTDPTAGRTASGTGRDRGNNAGYDHASGCRARCTDSPYHGDARR